MNSFVIGLRYGTYHSGRYVKGAAPLSSEMIPRVFPARFFWYEIHVGTSGNKMTFLSTFFGISKEIFWSTLSMALYGSRLEVRSAFAP